MIFSDFALLWDCVLGRIYNAAKEEVDSFFFFNFSTLPGSRLTSERPLPVKDT